ALLFLAAFPCWLMVGVIDRRIERSYERALERYREHNADAHPTIFKRSPELDIDDAGDVLDIYDCESLTFLGRLPKSDILAILSIYEPTPELLPHGSNDIPFCHDELQFIRHCEPSRLSETFSDVVARIIDDDNYASLTLRWVTPEPDDGDVQPGPGGSVK
ncbi:MAG: hypothetical protein AAGF72_19710, partial [Pseudomonadota bacterium]